ncbi:hypothetical protein GCM10023149_07260 [Mucilaginibacter gynuensis]|uniref:Uncharacterized protein n=1 Tax=Mucilaginibacter gynuensis TaxID=1302236 RepID=A0ABP8FVU2_9SPHI
MGVELSLICGDQYSPRTNNNFLWKSFKCVGEQLTDITSDVKLIAAMGDLYYLLHQQGKIHANNEIASRRVYQILNTEAVNTVSALIEKLKLTKTVPANPLIKRNTLVYYPEFLRSVKDHPEKWKAALARRKDNTEIKALTRQITLHRAEIMRIIDFARI